MLALTSTMLVIPHGQGATTRGYTCTYTKAQSGIRITVTIDGNDNGAYFCRSLNSGLHGRRLDGRVYGRVVCAWRAVNFDLRISLRVPNGLARAACTLMDSMLDGTGMFVRTR